MWAKKAACVLSVMLAQACTIEARAEQNPADRFLTAPQAAAAAKDSAEVDVPGSQHWVDSGIDLHPGDRARISVTGKLHYANSNENGPEGLPRGFRDLIRNLPVNDAGRGAAIARIGDAESSLAFLVGASKEIRAAVAGRLFIGINQGGNEQAEGSYHVKVEVLQRAPSTDGTGGSGSTTSAPAPSGGLTPGAATPLQSSAPTVGAAGAPISTPAQSAASQPAILPADIFNKIPRRIADKDGNPGDMVNFLILGSEDEVRQAFQAAGWVQVDRSVKEAALHGLLASLSKEAYTNMPMSELYLFGRAQDYGFAHAEPITVAMTRHHLRLWKASFAVNGQTLWVGAATHDTGLERDQRNNSITHKIDPAIDDERSYVEQTLSQTGLFSNVSYVTPSNPLTEAKTATGGSFHSDGRVLVLVLAAASTRDPSGDFSDLFCSVLQEEHPDEGAWGACEQYLEVPSHRKVALAAIDSRFRLLIVPGILNTCVKDAPAYEQGQKHLKTVHGLTVEYLAVPNDSSESNGKLIAGYLAEHTQSDPRKYIVLGYSKGAADLQTALARYPQAASVVVALVTVAGAIGGSPIADKVFMPGVKFLNSFPLGTCKGDLPEGLKSLRRDVRRGFLATFPDPIVPTYSLVAVSTSNDTSFYLKQGWRDLAPYSSEEDGQLTKADAEVPGSAYLGAALADHIAVAIPYEFHKPLAFFYGMDHNHFPRTALLEALVRFVLQDLPSRG